MSWPLGSPSLYKSANAIKFLSMGDPPNLISGSLYFARMKKFSTIITCPLDQNIETLHMCPCLLRHVGVKFGYGPLFSILSWAYYITKVVLHDMADVQWSFINDYIECWTFLDLGMTIKNAWVVLL